MIISSFIFYLFLKVVHTNEECGILKTVSDPPWTIGLYKQNGENLELLCLGTLFKPNFIVTAAHCMCESSPDIIRRETMFVKSGKIEKNIKLIPIEGLQKVNKSDIFLNKAYKGIETKGDIAVVKLEKNLTDTPICIDWNNVIHLVQDGDWLKHPTWQSGEIKLVDVSCVGLDICRESATSSFVKLITDDKICTKSQTEIPIDNIDEGAGLMYLNFVDNLWYLQGVASFKDIQPKLATYSRINVFLNWLSSISARP